MLEFLVEFAKLMLTQEGEFFPFGAGMKNDGDMTSLGADTGHDRATSRDLIALLHSYLVERASAGEIKASGICMDVRVEPPGSSAKTDAICVELEHRAGETVHVFVPYVIHSPGEVSYGEVFATPGEQVIFLPVAG
jgi:hypothetical protein